MSIPLVPLLLVVACSLGWAGFDLLRKLLVGKVQPVALVFLLTVGSAPLFAAWAVVDGAFRPGPGYWLPALGSVALNIVANLLFLQGMRIAPLSVTVPLLSLTPAFATLLAIPLLGERPSIRGSAGILMVIAGAIWLHWQPRDASSGPGTLKGGLMVAMTALFWSMTIPLDKMAVERAPAPFHGVVLTAGVAAGVLGVLLAQGRLEDVGQARAVPGLLVLALVVSSAALGLQLLALPKVYVGTVETLKRGIGNVMALLSGALFFGETVTPRRVLAVILMAVGVGLILS
ncbi:MAG TPA: DMT family transporter [Thermoanaerobaculia bacterium]|nr:DMT family transporter [Thermoanaerobaculia bacterium]